ncbi:hypothetical protein DVA67_018010 [Solirubrobacter sp. CPCC 204708]|uniref:Uncharacterized protein n=1 Tax=Solirubrobacter deserti TaxID=2282478 RepID=A0ABT4RD94_9ACTN|nr:hypothetical protein [Solirubrobacter deserti]MBE2317882.1 hypothetical protein [Solirubrobacter deserti]MDA0136341.1 hypothetical protein [Solirubrobacter deserti]
MNHIHELAYRAHDGIFVTMFWDAETNLVTVAVADEKTDDAFEVLVLPGERALDVFHHPYAYRAVREERSSTLVRTT